MKYRGLLFLGGPILVLGLLVATLLSRGANPPPRAVMNPAKKPPPTLPAVYTPARRVDPPKPGSSEQLARASEDSRIRSTYQSFRTAVATGNVALQNALRPVLARDLNLALRFGEDDLARSTDAADRAITARALEALRR